MTMLSLLCGALLSGCGIQGSLKTPPPVFGEPSVDADRVPDGSLDGDKDLNDLERLDRELETPADTDPDED